MCGINGIINYKKKTNVEDIHKMNNLLAHRGPDGYGSIKFENLLLGHTRLSIQDLSQNGAQPMSNDNNLWIIFNGEIYNFKEIKKELVSLGHKFYSDTDTEVILNSYKEWGVESFKKFNGMWSFAIYNKEKKEILICRDRYGVKPCYIYNHNDKFLFSSEIKPILKLTDDSLDQNKILLEENQKEGFFVTDFKNIFILDPGHYIIVKTNKKGFEKFRWWNSLNNLFKVSPNRKSIIEEYKHNLHQAVKLRLVSDVKISTSLSGGIDSSIIFSELNSLTSNNVNLNPFIINYPDNQTYKFAVNFATKLGREPIIIEEIDKLNIENILNTFRSLERKQYYSKQIGLYSSQKRNGYKISIDGHGADESLGGYTDNIKDFSIGFQNDLVDTYVAINNIDSSNLAKLLKSNHLSPINAYINANLSNYLNPTEKYNYIEISDKISISESCRKDLKELSNFDLGFQTLYLKSNYGFLQWLLNKWDRASMSQSIEIRSPFLDWTVFQYAISIPARHKTLNGKNKSLLRDAYKNQVSDEILDYKNKQGLPKVSNKVYEKLILDNSLNEKDFKESSIWDYSKITKNLNSRELTISESRELLKICETYLMNKSLVTLNDQFGTDNNFNYNLLNN